MQTLQEYVASQAEAEGYRRAFRWMAISALLAAGCALFIQRRQEISAFADDEPLWGRSG